MHRVAAIAFGRLSNLPHHGAVVALLAIAGVAQWGRYRGIAVVMICGTLTALAAINALGKRFGGI